MTYSITINCDNLNRAIARHTAYIGKSSGEELYNDIYITPEDQEVIDAIIKEAINSIVARYADIARMETVSADTALITFTLPYSSEAITQAYSLIEDYLIEYGTAAWCARATNEKDKAAQYTTGSTNLLAALDTAIYTPNAPAAPENQPLTYRRQTQVAGTPEQATIPTIIDTPEWKSSVPTRHRLTYLSQ